MNQDKIFLLEEQLQDQFDIDHIKQIAKQIKEKNQLRIILQFPNELLQFAKQMEQLFLAYLSESKLYILCDNLKHSCCLDLVGANHIKTYDCIIHIGLACYSEDVQQQNIELYYIFQQENNQINKEKYDSIIEYIKNSQLSVDIFIGQKLRQKKIMEQLKSYHDKEIDFYFSHQDIYQQKHRDEKRNLILLDEEDSIIAINILYCSNQYNYENVMLMNLNKNEQLINMNNKRDDLLFKRFNQIEKAKKFNTFGILYSNANNDNYVQIGEYCQKLLKHNDKKCYNFVINSLNEAKLNNFAEIEVYILISCSVNSIIDPKMYYKNILSPYELLLCLDEIEWNSSIQTDYQQLVNIFENQIENKGILMKNDKQDQQKQKVEDIQNQLATIDLSEKQVAKFQNDLFQNLDHFKNRTFQGLDKDQEVEVEFAKEGLKGIAGVYQSETQQNEQK